MLKDDVKDSAIVSPPTHARHLMQRASDEIGLYAGSSCLSDGKRNCISAATVYEAARV